MAEIQQSVVNFLLIGLEIYQFLILLYVLSSWFGGLPKNRFGDFIRDLIAPIMNLAKRIPHHLGPIDLSPIYAFLLVGFAKILVIVIANG